MDEIELSLKEVQDAVPVVKEVAYRTPLIRSYGFEDEDVWLKLENLQRLGSFKIRGIWHCVSGLSPEERARGLAIFSAGNAGLALAWTAKRLGVPCMVIVSEGADARRIDAIIAQGGSVEIMPLKEIFRILETGTRLPSPFTFINPVGDRRIVAGVGTVGLEIVQDLPKAKTIIVPVGGGDLAAGVAVAAKGIDPKVKVFGVQTEGAAVLPESLKTGRGYRLEKPPHTIADSIATPLMLEKMASFLSRQLDGALLVSDEEVKLAMRSLAVESKVIAEPAGAVALAAYIRHERSLEKPVVAIVSGGNVSPRLLAETISGPPST